MPTAMRKQYDKATQVARKQAAQAMPKKQDRDPAHAGRPTGGYRQGREGIKLAKAQLNGNATIATLNWLAADLYADAPLEGSGRRAIDKADALSTNPDDKIYIYFLRGALEERQKHYDSAEEQFRKISGIDPNNGMTLNYLGYMLADRGVSLDDALTMVQKAVQLDPQNGAYLDSLGWVYFKMGQYASRKLTCVRPVSASAPIPRYMTIWVNCTKKPAGSSWPLRNGSRACTSMPGPFRPMPNPPM